MNKNKSTRELMEEAVKRARSDRQIFKEIGEDFQKEFSDHKGPVLGPRDDIEKRKILNDIEDSGKDEE